MTSEAFIGGEKAFFIDALTTLGVAELQHITPVTLDVPITQISQSTNDDKVVAKDFWEKLRNRPLDLLKLIDVLLQKFPAQPQVEALKPHLIRLQSKLEPLTADVENVTGAFAQLAQRPSEAVNEPLTEARDDLASVSQRLLQMEACKDVHEALHGIQTTTYVTLLELVASKKAVDESDLESIEDEIPAIEDHIGDIRIALMKLNGEDVANAEWLMDFDDAINQLRQRPLGMADISAALWRVRGKLRRNLPKFATAIAIRAEKVPFVAAVEFLESAAGQDGASPEFVNSLQVAARELDTLRKELGETLELHKKWQTVDTELWELEQAVGEQAVLDEVTLKGAWMVMEEVLASVRDASPTIWEQVEGSYERVSSALNGEDTLSDKTRTDLKAFIRRARLTFHRVDRSLREQCARIGLIRIPLEQLLQKAV